MQSSTKEHFPTLDYIRGLAAFLVVQWHFAHGYDGTPIPFATAPWLPFLDEGHVGVALFMTLSGYLFAKLLTGREIIYLNFFINRVLRLAPLFLVMLVGAYVAYARPTAMSPGTFARNAAHDILIPYGNGHPNLPNGGWSVIAEVHFYLLLPLLLTLQRRWRPALAILFILMIGVRAAIFLHQGEVFGPAYYTVIGRFDQFLAGMIAASIAPAIRARRWLAIVTAMAFYCYYVSFTLGGGLNGLRGSAIWIVHPTIEGLSIGILIAWFDRSYRSSDTPLRRLVARAGDYSYSVYLLHFFLVFAVADALARRVPFAGIGAAWAYGTLFFLAMMAVGWCSMKVVEQPFLRLKRSTARPASPHRSGVENGIVAG